MRDLRCVLLAVFVGFLVTSALSAAEKITALESDKTIQLKHGDNILLTYHKADVAPPEGVDPVYTRNGFIHPVRSPKGVEVTGIHPDDHYHHLGIWHAWVKCLYDGKEVDFWNLKKKQGKVTYVKTLQIEGAGFTVEQAHVAFLEGDKPTVILKEELHVEAKLVNGAYEIDYQTKQTNVGKHSLELPAYRYGGPIAYRAPHGWKNGNSDYLSSEGKTRINGHETRSKWCAMYGAAGEGKMAGLTILCHKENHDFPQRMRVWPPKSNDGAIFFNYVPIQEKGWAIKAGETSVMRYRLVVEDTKPDPAVLNQRWEAYCEKAGK